mgnify:CR=1 FL=1
MAFTKIRQTVEAFRSPRPIPMRDYIEQHRSDQHARQRPAPPVNRSANVAAKIVVLVSISYGLSAFLHNVLSVSAEASGIMSGILGYAIATIHGRVYQKIIELPIYLLNPYFGSKLEETVRALRRPKRNPEQPQLL